MTIVYRFFKRMQTALPRPHNGIVLALLSVGASLAIAACGQVITVAPTPTTMPTPTIALALMAATAPPTVTPAPYTPAPTATPTVTPTPIIHEVKAGESLLAVAAQYDVSVNALQDANGITDPRALQVGQQLIIPNEEEVEVEANHTPTPTPMPVTVTNVNLSETKLGELWVLGEAVNESDTPLEQVRVGVTLLDENGDVVEEAGSPVALDVLKVDERAPFALLFATAPGDFARYMARPLSAVPAYMGGYYRDLEVRGLTGAPAGVTSYGVNGRVFNSGPEEAVEVQVVVTAYDPLDRVIAVRVLTPDPPIAPVGGETSFAGVLTPLGGPVARIEAVAQGRRISAAGE